MISLLKVIWKNNDEYMALFYTFFDKMKP